jgi:decaprenyl-phosphate phosphoribosyltransferase
MARPGNAYIQLLRPHQYVKNLFIFLPQFFGMQITNTALLGRTVFAFVAFSLMASAVYVFNDYHDREEDRNHPQKRSRPLASGRVTPTAALVLAVALLAVAGIIFVALGTKALVVAVVYLALNVAYTLLLKHVPILDAFSVASGFVLRLSVGSAVTAIVLSKWIVLMTFLLALFLAFAKRRSDVLIYLESGQKSRKLVDGYNLQVLDAFMVIVASVVIVAYIMYTVSAEVVARTGTENLYFTVAFVILGIMRYLQISIVRGDGGSPTQVFLRDRFIQLSVLGWALANAAILYRPY